MNRLALTVAITLAVPSLHASDPTDVGQPFSLAAQPRVQQILELTDAEAAAVKELHAQVRQGTLSGEAVGKALAGALPAAKQVRLRQISYQVLGGAALADPAVQKAVGLSKAQQEKIDGIWRNEELNLQMVLRVSRFRSAAARTAFILRHRREAGDKLLPLLQDEQKAALARLRGKAIDLKGLDG